VKPDPILHVGKHACVVHRTRGLWLSATHVVETVGGRRVGYWRRYSRGWSVTVLGPEWWT
jgi:hypothetical protein